MRHWAPGQAAQRRWARQPRVRSGRDSSRCLLWCLLRGLVLLGDLPDRRDDVGVGGAAAEIAAHALANLVVVEGDLVGTEIGGDGAGPAGRGLAQHPDRRAELPRCAIAALEGVVRDERPLERVQVVATHRRQPLDRDDLTVLMRDGERQAAIDSSPVQQDGAGAALPMIAALLRAGNAEALT